MTEYAQVAVAAPVRNLFTYRIPKEMEDSLAVGQLVEVPFGRGRRRGIVLALTNDAPAAAVEIKPIGRVVEPTPILDKSMIHLLTWAARYYLAPAGEMVFSALPPLFRKCGRAAGQKHVRVVHPSALATVEVAAGLEHRAPEQARVLKELICTEGRDLAELCRLSPGSRQAVSALRRKGLVFEQEQVRTRRPPAADLPLPPRIERLTVDQERALAALRGALDRGCYSAFLLHGVTGSGKTEVYLRAIGHVLERGQGAILLVPEISLTPQLISRVVGRFGQQVAQLHSGLGAGERLDEWRRLKTGAARVAVGARSAVFAPVQDLGILVVDEEHDPSYKQSDRLPYSGRDLAMVRAHKEGIVVLLGTATPSVESYAHALSGRSTLLTLSTRVQERPLPLVEVVDLKADLMDPLERLHTIGPRLAAALAETLDRGEQAILFLNRRGYSAFALCPDCGEGIRCQNCSVALVHHLQEQQLRCHYCGLTTAVPERCPACGKGRVGLFGFGCEKCEEEVRRRFPGARVTRLDSDSVSKRGLLEEVLSRFARGEVDILVGTQMVTKGHDVPGVTLVGVVLADLGLQLPDFRAGERTFQLLMQVAGRAGRGDRPGRVVIQTFMPEHPSIQLAREHRFEEFFRRELARREQLAYPPSGKLLMVRLSHPDPGVVAGLSGLVADEIRQTKGGRIRLLGPVASPLAKLRGRYRWQLLVKSETARDLQTVALAVQHQVRLPAGAKIIFDMDPIDML